MCSLSHLSQPPGRFLVVDVGCGSFATFFGMAIAFAMTDNDAPLVFHCIDPSKNMKTIGNELLSRMCSLLKNKSNKHGHLSNLLRILRDSSITYEFSSLTQYWDRYTEAHVESTTSYDDIWLTAIHTAYDEGDPRYNAKTLAENIRQSERELAPKHTQTIITGMDGDPVKRIAGSPPSAGPPRDITDHIVFKGPCREIMTLRHEIADEIAEHLDDKHKRLLCKQPKWDPTPSKAKILIWICKTPYQIDPNKISSA